MVLYKACSGSSEVPALLVLSVLLAPVTRLLLFRLLSVKGGGGGMPPCEGPSWPWGRAASNSLALRPPSPFESSWLITSEALRAELVLPWSEAIWSSRLCSSSWLTLLSLLPLLRDWTKSRVDGGGGSTDFSALSSSFALRLPSPLLSLADSRSAAVLLLMLRPVFCDTSDSRLCSSVLSTLPLLSVSNSLNRRSVAFPPPAGLGGMALAHPLLEWVTVLRLDMVLPFRSG